jgi:hypothetical protein
VPHSTRRRFILGIAARFGDIMRDSNASTELPLISSGRKPIVSVIVTLCLLLVALLGVTFGIQAGRPQDSSAVATTILAAAVFCLTPFVLLRIVGRARATVEEGDLVMQTGVGKKRVPLANLRRHGIEVIDLAQHPELRPLFRLWGTSMPGLSTGWFRLRNGEKAVCLLTDRRHVSYLRSDDDNISLLLSLQNPGTLKALLER